MWVYGSEAHPEEYPFAAGFESTDLGWTHPYSISTTMDERAQRAKWMKTDPEPDFELPMIIDFINHPTATNNAIRAEFRGGGFYSGYVIDCDGKVLKAHNWAWFAPGGEWWNLPLTPISDLHKFLDGYLANPPACYGSTPSPSPDGGMQSQADATIEPPPDAAGADVADAGVTAVADAVAAILSTPPQSGGCHIANSTKRTDTPNAFLILILGAGGLITYGRRRSR